MSKESMIDEKLEQLLTAYTEDYFYAESKFKFDDKIDSAKACTLKFTYDFNDCGHLGISVKGKAINGICLEWCDPGIKALLAFFYALERGYEKIFLDEYDYYDNFARYTVMTSRESDYAILDILDNAGIRKTSKIVINKEKSIKNFKKMLKENFSGEKHFKDRVSEVSYSIETGNLDGEDGDDAEKMVEEWNFIRGLDWVFDAPFPEQSMRDFLDDESYEKYLNWKEKSK